MTQLVAAILASVGGGGALVLAFSSWFGSVWADKFMEKEKTQHARELESFRNDLAKQLEQQAVALRKSEVLFAKQIDAASALIELNLRLVPEKRFTDEDWYDARSNIALDFRRLYVCLQSYLSTYGVTISADVRKHLSAAYFLLADRKAEVEMLQAPEVSGSLNKAADDVYRRFKNAERAFLEDLQNQVAS